MYAPCSVNYNENFWNDMYIILSEVQVESHVPGSFLFSFLLIFFHEILTSLQFEQSSINDLNVCHSRTVLQFNKLFFVDMVVVSNTLHIR